MESAAVAWSSVQGAADGCGPLAHADQAMTASWSGGCRSASCVADLQADLALVVVDLDWTVAVAGPAWRIELVSASWTMR